MSVAEIAGRDPVWLDGSGPAADIVLSTRVRLARNLSGRRFSHHAAESELISIRREVSERVMGRPEFDDGCQVDIETCSGPEKKCLLEKHLASSDLLSQPEHRSLLLNLDMSRVVMVNEEDHLRLQLFRSGFDPSPACQEALALDTRMEEVFDFSFNEDWGYLTSCPTNIGTGFRLSVLIHLPGLVLAGEIERILNSLRQLQFTVRGLFGEGSSVQGALFQISNLVTLGKSEENLTTDFARHVAKVIHYERLAREKLLERDSAGQEDMVHRSYAILQSARLLTTREAFDRLSHVRMGGCLGLVPVIPVGVLNNALVRMQSGHLQLAAGHRLKGRKRAAARAEFFRQLFQ